ncbi:MAG: PilW family protein [bacterium]
MLKNKILKTIHNENGVTLIELIIAVVISLLVLAAASFILLSQSGVFRSQNSISTEQQNLNIAYNKLKYSLRLAGFDYGSNYFYASKGTTTTTTGVPPVQIVPANYPTSPFAILIANFSVINNGAPCVLTAVANQNANATSSEFNLGQNCNIANFTAGQLLSFQNPTPLQGKSLSGSMIFCITNVQTAAKKIQLSPGNGIGVCPNNPNPIPPNGVAGGNISILTQTMFYWGNAAYSFNSPFNGINSLTKQPDGGLYECQIMPAVNITTEPAGFFPACYPNTTMRLDNYITEFSVNPSLTTNLPLSNSLIQGISAGYNASSIYLYNLLIQGETNTVISDSPNYSVNSKYNSNLSNSSGYNISETLNSNVFLRNVYYGS